MPWNPMRVEQRIGRIDRIGGHPQVSVRHYFYENTVEAKIYQALEDRIGWFEAVVGELQPILARLGRTIQNVAMTPQASREQVLSQELGQLESELNEQAAEGLDLDQYLLPDEPVQLNDAPVTLADLGRTLPAISVLKPQFQSHPKLTGAYHLHTNGSEAPVTFDAALFDDHPDSLHLLTYGSPLLADLLTTALKAYVEIKNERRILRCAVQSPLPVAAYYALDAAGQPRRIQRLAEVEQIYADTSLPTWSAAAVEQATQDFAAAIQTTLARQAEVVANRLTAERLVLVERARQTLLQTALIELAMGQQPEMFRQEELPAAFNEAAITSLKRHKYPFAPLLKLVNISGLRPTPTDPFFTDVQGRSKDSLRQQWLVRKDRAHELVKQLANFSKAEDVGLQDTKLEIEAEYL